MLFCMERKSPHPSSLPTSSFCPRACAEELLQKARSLLCGKSPCLLHSSPGLMVPLCPAFVPPRDADVHVLLSPRGPAMYGFHLGLRFRTLSRLLCYIPGYSGKIPLIKRDTGSHFCISYRPCQRGWPPPDRGTPSFRQGNSSCCLCSPSRPFQQAHVCSEKLVPIHSWTVPTGSAPCTGGLELRVRNRF